MNGRGAWPWDGAGGTIVNDAAGTHPGPYYELAKAGGVSLVGQVVSDRNSTAVHLGVMAIQKRINTLGYTPTLVVDGVFGSATHAGVVWAQKQLNMVTNYTPGRVGHDLAKALWRPLVVATEQRLGIPLHHLGGILEHESGSDPGAVGTVNYQDSGLLQFNLASDANVTVKEAFDPVYAIAAGGQRLADARATYAAKGAALQTFCSIAQHNSPLWAQQWYQSGTAPNDIIIAYVQSVLSKSAVY